jgi:hypothetical protein
MGVSLLSIMSAANEARGEAIPPNWKFAYDYLVQDVCVDAKNKLIVDATPMDDTAKCPAHRNIAIGENLPYHKDDFPKNAELARRPWGYTRNDTFPITTKLFGTAVIQSRGFLSANGIPGTKQHPTGGGGIFLFSPESVASGLTEDPTGIQFFFGPQCNSSDPSKRLLDAWVVVDKTFGQKLAGSTVAHLTRYSERCPARLSPAYTSWYVKSVRFRISVNNRESKRQLEALISNHFSAASLESSTSLERFYYTKELGLVRWERWQNALRDKRPTDTARANALAQTGQCDPIESGPGAAWLMVACRQWTNLISAQSPLGDPPTFWINHIRVLPATAAYFAE